jgi:hypothetical protein
MTSMITRTNYLYLYELVQDYKYKYKYLLCNISVLVAVRKAIETVLDFFDRFIRVELFNRGK